MGKAERNKKQKKDALLNTAFELFTSKGITDTTISNIVDRAGVAKGTFYLYFKDKYDIRNKLIAHKASQVFTKAEEALHQTDITLLEDKIIFLVDHILEQFNEDKILLRFISKNLSWGIFKMNCFIPLTALILISMSCIPPYSKMKRQTSFTGTLRSCFI